MISFQTDYGAWHVPDGVELELAFARTTQMGIGAHQDDLEIMAIEGILQCYRKHDEWFTGVIVTDGATAPRTGRFADFSNDDMARVRIEEQKKAADIGEYSAQVLLGYETEAVKSASDERVVNDLVELLTHTEPDVVYTHNLLDKHDAHVGVALNVIRAIRKLPHSERPERVVGCEVWRDLDWLVGDDKVVMDSSPQADLQRKSLEAFESQIEGKRYDLAAMGRRLAHATYLEPHEIDDASGVVLGMDLTPLVEDESLDVRAYAMGYVERLRGDVEERLERLT